MKKFYHLVSITPQAQGYAVLLDGKPVKTQGGQVLISPTEEIAMLVMREWMAQVDVIDPQSMPVTQILVTHLDRVMAQRPVLQKELLGYLDTDLLCYRADNPPEAGHAQAVRWDPVLKWFEEHFAIKLKTTTSLSPIRQDKKAHQAVETYVLNLPDTVFTVLQILTAETGSLLLALAFVEGQVSPADAFEVAQVDEEFKAGLYNEDKYGRAPDTEKHQKSLRLSLQAAHDFLDAL